MLQKGGRGVEEGVGGKEQDHEHKQQEQVQEVNLFDQGTTCFQDSAILIYEDASKDHKSKIRVYIFVLSYFITVQGR